MKIKCPCGKNAEVKIKYVYYCEDCAEDAELKSKCKVGRITKEDKRRKMKKQYD